MGGTWRWSRGEAQGEIHTCHDAHQSAPRRLSRVASLGGRTPRAPDASSPPKRPSPGPSGEAAFPLCFESPAD